MAALKKGKFQHIDLCIINDKEGKLGRSNARNVALEKEADWVFFLDADDLMHPLAFETMSDYMDYDAVWGNIYEYSNGVCVWRYQVPEIRTYRELISFDPYTTLQMGHFIRKDKLVPFNNEMDCGEDWDYYIRIWKNNKCIKIREPLFINRRGIHSTGPRSATGREWSETVHNILEKERSVYENTCNR